MRVGAVLVVVLLAARAFSEVTTAVRFVGASGGHSSCGGNQDPPVLCDGVTEARAEIRFTYDDETELLVVGVRNTSPVLRGVPNPLLTELYFTVPPRAVTGLEIMEQRSQAGIIPAWNLDFDAELRVNPNPNHVGGFGNHSAGLSAPQGAGSSVHQSIANELADTLAVPEHFVIRGLVEFVFHVDPVLGAALTASTIGSSMGQDASQFHVNLVGKFQAGGVAEAGGKLSTATGCSPAAYSLGPPRIGSTISIVMSGRPGCQGFLLFSIDPGPTIFEIPGGRIELPVGLPFYEFIPTTTLPAVTWVARDVQIPDEPFLINKRVFFAAVGFDPGTGTVEVSDQLAVRFLP